jgi:hypothetical protein
MLSFQQLDMYRCAIELLALWRPSQVALQREFACRFAASCRHLGPDFRRVMQPAKLHIVRPKTPHSGFAT